MRKLPLCFAVLLGVMSAASLHGKNFRTFTTADQSKAIVAAVVGVFNDDEGRMLVEIEREDGKRYKVLPEIFSDEDQAAIKEAVAILNAGRHLALTITPKEDRSSPSESDGRRIVTAKHAFDLMFRNNGTADLEGLEVEYRIFYQKDERTWDTRGDQKIGKSKRAGAYTDGTMKVEGLAARAEKVITTREVALISDRPNLGGPG